VKADEVRDGAMARTETGGFVVKRAAEQRTLQPNRALLEQLSQATGGREINQPADAFARDGEWVATRWIDLWPWLLGMALLILPLDVAARRLSLWRS
jgi:hypothetical protein